MFQINWILLLIFIQDIYLDAHNICFVEVFRWFVIESNILILQIYTIFVRHYLAGLVAQTRGLAVERCFWHQHLAFGLQCPWP